jgi:RNA polymerase sigma-70 factor (ECF subfamily)
VLQHETKAEAFTSFVEAHEASLRNALTAALGFEVGREAAAEALVYGWANWDRVSAMDNPAGYLYRVGRNLGRRMHRRRRVLLPATETVGEPLVEPGLPAALAALSERQRVVIWLIHSADWSMSEVAGFLGISKASVQTHTERGMAKLRRRMGAAR